jgi:hypothetical protein
MPKKIDPALRDRAVRLVRERRSEYSSLTAASAAVARQVGVGEEFAAVGAASRQQSRGRRRAAQESL